MSRVVDMPERSRSFICETCGISVVVACPIDNKNKCLTCRFFDREAPELGADERRDIYKKLRYIPDSV